MNWLGALLTSIGLWTLLGAGVTYVVESVLERHSGTVSILVVVGVASIAAGGVLISEKE